MTKDQQMNFEETKFIYERDPYIKMRQNDHYLFHMELFTVYLKYLIFMCGVYKAACYECLLLITNGLYPLFSRNIFFKTFCNVQQPRSHILYCDLLHCDQCEPMRWSLYPYDV